MENKKENKIPDFLIRAAKTFMQAFISVIVLNITAIMTHIVNWDFSDWKGWLAPILIAALAAGIAALWNFIIERVNAKAQMHIFDFVKQEEVQELIESLIPHDEETEEEVKEEKEEPQEVIENTEDDDEEEDDEEDDE